MHRIASQPGDDTSQNLTLIEQPSADVILITSAESDITTLSNVIKKDYRKNRENYIRAINLSQLASNAQIDHYISTTCRKAKIIIIRLLGSRSQWSYGIEQFLLWNESTDVQLILLSGTKDNEIELNGLSSINYKLSIKLGELLRIGGTDNMLSLLSVIDKLIKRQFIRDDEIKTTYLKDPYLYDWKNDNGRKIAILAYSSYFQAGDISFIDILIKYFRDHNLTPRVIFIKTLKNLDLQKKLIDIIKSESIDILITTTSFSINNSQGNEKNFNLLSELNIPTIQMLISTSSKSKWTKSSRGMSPTDLSLQVVLPEIDGRITTKIIAFREKLEINTILSTPVYITKPDTDSIIWCIKLIQSWLTLLNKENSKTKITLVLSNYPISDGRIGNGVGLDTPKSTLNILKWLKQEGYDLGKTHLPLSSKKLFEMILSRRTNTLETSYKEPLTYVSLECYMEYWKSLPIQTKLKIEEKWGEPHTSKDLEKEGISVNGIQFGNVALIIQPSRGYSEDNIQDVHSPYLPPTHRYLATYNWIYKTFKSDVIVHIGKHGTAEWLPGKAVGLSPNCFPEIVLPPIPHIYPFIVNDPGEGSQAKRRTHAIIIDHLTPPISRAGTYGYLEKLEILFDEYNEASLMGSYRKDTVKEQILKIISDNNLADSSKNITTNKIDSKLQDIEAYICELKESQIRTGLHIFGQKPKINKLSDLALSIALNPSYECLGLSQSLSIYLGLDIDPWNAEESDSVTERDFLYLRKNFNIKIRTSGKLIHWINNQSQSVIIYLLFKYLDTKKSINYYKSLDHHIKAFIDNESSSKVIKKITNVIIPGLIDSGRYEKESFLKSIKGAQIDSGPSGSPTRGKVEVLPTGRNFYSLDLRSLPTQAAWDLGRRSAENLLELHKLETGNELKNLAMSVWGTATMRNGGEDISQMLALMGLIPIWDTRNLRIIDLEIVPLSLLNRSRVDVTLRISGLFRDSFPNLIELINRGIKIISTLDEPSELNPLACSRRKGENTGRVYGSAPETYGTGLQELINLGNWENNSDFANTYLEWSKWLYINSEEPISDSNGLATCLKNVQVVIHNKDNNEHDILDSDDYYQFHGGLYSAVKKISGNNPKIYLGDHSKHSKPKINSLEKEIDKVVRNRMLNPKWIDSIKDHGYKGAFEMSASIDYLFAYDATTENVPKWCYSEINKSWLDDSNTLNFLRTNNPWALRDIAERFLEAHNRNLWKNAKKSEISRLKQIVLEVEHDIESLT